MIVLQSLFEERERPALRDLGRCIRRPRRILFEHLGVLAPPVLRLVRHSFSVDGSSIGAKRDLREGPAVENTILRKEPNFRRKLLSLKKKRIKTDDKLNSFAGLAAPWSPATVGREKANQAETRLIKHLKKLKIMNDNVTIDRETEAWKNCLKMDQPHSRLFKAF